MNEIKRSVWHGATPEGAQALFGISGRKDMMMKDVEQIIPAPRRHWAGESFPNRTLFTYHDDTAALSPFLLLDYAVPWTFAPDRVADGIGRHPHRGFETVTIVFDGEMAHQDSAGAGGIIGPGDVQ
jgi:redox-sensitive bicupin YhaK (pirin superfamily)